MQSALDAVRVAQMLKELESNVDVAATPRARHRVDRLLLLAMEQLEQAGNDQQDPSPSSGVRYEVQRAATEKELRNMQSEADWVVCEPLLACADSFSEMVCPVPPTFEGEAVPAPPGGKPAATKQRQNEMSGMSSGSLAPPAPIPPPPAPLPPPSTFGPSIRSRTAPAWVPATWSAQGMMSEDSLSPIPEPHLIRHSHSSSNEESFAATTLRRTTTEEQLEKALFLSGLEVSNTDVSEPDSRRDQDQKLRRGSQRLELATLSTLYHDDFNSLVETGRVRISYADTFQGRVPESCNGCTVIAPLMCIHHLLEIPPRLPDTGLTDVTILQVIDLETPAILTQLRKELGLAPAAFLIPSDAHDYLIENGQLSQQQFVTVTGGNILDDQHLQNIVKTLSDREKKHRKLAATLFFHEHVVSILRVERDSKTSWYDLIDSLPLKATMKRPGESEQIFHRRMGLELTQEEMDDKFLPMTARIRCLNEEALAACLRWYACSKFNEENMSYIDQYAWDENTCDFDPRVFQAFVWSEAPQ